MTGSATAADLVAPAAARQVPAVTAAAMAPWGWTGFYIGAHGGGAWGSDRYLDGNLAVAGIAAPVIGTVHPGGGFGGGQIGYNSYLTAHWILGYELDISAGDISQTGRASNPTVAVSSKTDDFGTARTRLGYALDRWLIYGTAGTAWAHTRFTESVSLGPILFSQDLYHLGWTAGAGVEYAVTRNWSVKAEYLYANLGKEKVSYAAPQSSEFTLNRFQVGLNYRFDGTAPSEGADPAYPVKAARAPVPTPWSGSYLGGHGGFSRGRLDVVDGTITTPMTINRSDLDPFGGFVGYQTGYNWRIAPSWVASLESDSSLGSLTDNRVASPRADLVNAKTDWFGSERARLGFLATDAVLLYGTGGLAWAHVKFKDMMPGGAPATALDQYRVGWTAGAGLEYGFHPLWSVKVEYLRADLGRYSDIRFLSAAQTGARTAQFTSDTLKVGINYHGDVLHTLLDRFGLALP